MTIWIIGIIGIMVFGFFMWYFEAIKRQREMEEWKKRLEKFRNHSGSLVVNSRNGVVAVCAQVNFINSMLEYLKRTDEALIAKIILQPRRTFTFSEREDLRRPIHTGLVKDLEKILREIVKEFTGHGDTSDEALKIISPRLRDCRLKVPFSGNNPTELKRELDFHGRTTLAEARAEIRAAFGLS